VLDDAMLDGQTRDRFAAVMRPKADAVWMLRTMLEANAHRPRFFVTYSSMSAVFGSPGQGNYAAANAFLDAVANRAAAHSQPMLSIGWGAWAETGMAARGGVGDRAAARGISALTVSQGLTALDTLIRAGTTACVAVAPIDWKTVGASLGTAGEPALLKDILQSAGQVPGEQAARQRAVEDYASMEPQTRRQQLVELVQRELGFVLGTGAAAGGISHDETFASLGLDSLTSVELRNRLQSCTGRAITPTAVFDWPTIAALGGYLDSLYGGSEQSGVVAADREEFVL
jgi:acyl carrier protein